MKKIIIQDTTLRDGEQTPGVAFSFNDKVKVVNVLLELGVDAIELGFPAASKEEEKIIKKLANKFSGNKKKFCVFSRIKEKDIVIAHETTKKLINRRLQIVVPASNLHIKYSINKTKKQILEDLKKSLKIAKSYFDEIQLTAQDAPRADKEFLFLLIKTSIEGGAKIIGLPDTVGCCTPNEYGNLIKNICEKFKSKKDLIISAHCHNDLGLATANSIIAIDSGAKQVEVTLNGLGERAGNTPLEEILAILDLKKKYLLSKNINLKVLNKANKVLQTITKIKAPHNKPIVGKNVFTHASGMHQKAVIKNKNSFEVINASKFGAIGGNILIGKLSGKAAIKKMLNDHNLKLEENKIDKLMKKIKNKAQIKKTINISDIKDIIKKLV